MVQPRFSAFSFWNYVESAKVMDAHTPSPPLGLTTVAAILPQHWEFRLLDLNCTPFSEADWQWADLVCVGGMLPQQRGILEVIARAKKDGKFVVVGGADASSQPATYSHADALVVGEGESAIPVWMESWRAGKPSGVFRETEKPDVTQSPVPRFDLLDFRNYVQVGIQYSRGCPFNCEFCDIIELYGRKPRTKTPEQVCAELTALRKLHYSGSVDIVDDNLIGNKRAVKRYLLPALIEWNKNNKHRFWYCTEASMNLMDDDELMAQMQEADFRVVFMGIETPDPDILLMTQKSQNTVRPIVERVNKLYKYGIAPTAGFIMGFDGEKKGTDVLMTKLVEDTNINIAMVGLLVALPRTQLTRRLLKEGRLLSFAGQPVKTEAELLASASHKGALVEVVDQTVSGLNYVTTRDRVEILEEYVRVVSAIYEPRAYFDRALRVGRLLNSKSKHRPNWFELRRLRKGFFRTSWRMTKNPKTRWLYWRNVFLMIPRGRVVFEQVSRLMGIYLHFEKQVAYLKGAMKSQIEGASAWPMERRMVVKAPKTAEAADGPGSATPPASGGGLHAG
jgi:radical SAM superfamily enzyme YgiQ (UPF0313 family)